MQLRLASFAAINLPENVYLQKCTRAGRIRKKRNPSEVPSEVWARLQHFR
jgi:hypothetical protein